ncbi:MAG: carboxypeptidase-like regulatory domain-containing protein [Janthinobacterium lividum]
MKHKLLLFPLVLATSAAFAQTRSLSGQVLDAAGRPVIGATVVEKGTNNGIGTDANGRFVLRAHGPAATGGERPRLLDAGNQRRGQHHRGAAGRG